MNPAVQQLASVAAPVVVVIALVGFGLWLFSWVSARAKASHIEQDLPASAVDLGPLVEVPAKVKAWSEKVGLPTPAERARAIVDARAKAEQQEADLRQMLAMQVAAKQAEQAEMESILAKKPEAST